MTPAASKRGPFLALTGGDPETSPLLPLLRALREAGGELFGIEGAAGGELLARRPEAPEGDEPILLVEDAGLLAEAPEAWRRRAAVALVLPVRALRADELTALEGLEGCGLRLSREGGELRSVELVHLPGMAADACDKVWSALRDLDVVRLRSEADLPGGSVERVRVPLEQELWRVARETGLETATLDHLARQGLAARRGPLERLEQLGPERRQEVWDRLREATLGEGRFRWSGEALPPAGRGLLATRGEEPLPVEGDPAVPEPQKVLIAGSPSLVKLWSEAIYQSAGGNVSVEGWQLWELGSATEEDYKAITRRGPYDLVLELMLAPMEERHQLLDMLLPLLDSRGQLWVHTLSLPSVVTVQVVPEEICAVGFGGLPPLQGGQMHVELVRPRNSDLGDLQLAAGMAHRLGITPWEVADEPGGVGARMLATAVNSAGWLLREGLVLAEGEADQLVKRVLEMEIGPFALADEVGLDALEAVLVGLQATLGEERYRVCPTLTMRLEAGMSGRAAGRGFFVP